MQPVWTTGASEMRLVDNPTNALSRRGVQWLEVQGARLQVVEERACSLLTCNDSPDIGFRWSVNPYRGCQHACAYCYARRTHEYLDLGAGSDFDTQIHVKINAPELLAAELARKSWRREEIAFSGVTDCYQPLEARYRLTRQCLEVCALRANPVGIVTKAPLVLRDLDVLAALNARADVSVYISIAFADDAVARKVDVGAPAPSQRFDTVSKLAAAGIRAGVMIAPIIPGLNDRDIPTLLEQAAACGAQAASFMPVRLPGNVAEVFLTRLRRELPEHADRVEARIRDMHNGRLNDPRFGARMSGDGPYWRSVQKLFQVMATRYDLDGGQAWKQCERRESPRQMTLF